MTDHDQAPAMTTSVLEGDRRRDADRRRAAQPLFTPLDVVALIVAVAMIWGPLAAGALRQ